MVKDSLLLAANLSLSWIAMVDGEINMVITTMLMENLILNLKMQNLLHQKAAFIPMNMLMIMISLNQIMMKLMTTKKNSTHNMTSVICKEFLETCKVCQRIQLINYWEFTFQTCHLRLHQNLFMKPTQSKSLALLT